MPRRHAQDRPDPDLERLAGRLGVLTRYVDGLGAVRVPSEQVVRALCGAISPEPSAAAAVATVGARGFWIKSGARGRISGSLHLEEGGDEPVGISRGSKPGHLHVRLRHPLPLGVHRLMLEVGRECLQVFVLARPRSLGRIARADRRLAVFVPLYAVSSEGRPHVGTYSELRDLCAWADRVAGALVGTLPLFPAFLDSPFDPSPYAPVSRLMWNELFVNPHDSPEWREVRGRASAGSDPGRRSATKPGKLVDYRRAWKTARGILKELSSAARASPRRWAQVLSQSSAETMRYAQFRAAVDATGKTWEAWPARWRAGRIDSSQVDPRDVDLYVYAQALASAQLLALGQAASSQRPLYLDLPVGVHAHGFDTYTRPDLFLQGFSAGAPPDALNAHGQVWGFPPMHPTAARADGYAHLRSVLRQMLRVAGVLRIDHVMGLYRMFCVPTGHSGTEGAYLRYPEDELFAIVLIEAARAGAVVVGEDLGTVPAPVRRLMRRHGILGMHVQQFAFGTRPGSSIKPAGAHTLACLNTHDTPTFAGFWNGDDIALRLSLGHSDTLGAARERSSRAAVTRAVRTDLSGQRLPSRAPRDAAVSLMRLQCRGPAPICLVNLEDLWGERRPQNVPGTSTEHPNWRRRVAKPLRTILRERGVARVLSSLRRERRAHTGAQRP